MFEWIRIFLYDKSGFERICRSSAFFVGYLMQSGVIPTGIPDGGKILGPILMGTSLIITAGEKNKEK
jgi:hypothetical protein